MAIAFPSGAAQPAPIMGVNGTPGYLRSSSFTPPANGLVIVCIFNDSSYGGLVSSVSDSVAQLTNWRQLATGFGPDGTPDMVLDVWVADAPASPAACTVTPVFSLASTMNSSYNWTSIHIMCVTGAATATNQATAHTNTAFAATAAATSPSCAISAAASDSWVLGMNTNYTNSTIPTPSGSQVTTFGGRSQVMQDAAKGWVTAVQGNPAPGNSPLSVVTTAPTSIEWGAATFEILAGGATGPTVSAVEAVDVTDVAAASVAGSSIDVSNLEYHGSGASNLGGAIAGVITGGAANNVWDDVTSGESASGDVEYRCIYIKNAHPMTTWIAPKVWIDTQATPDTAAIALDSAAVGSTAASTSANETTAPTGGGAPYTFTSPTTKATGLQIADIPPGQYKAIWLRRTVPSSAPANPADAMSVRCEGNTP